MEQKHNLEGKEQGYDSQEISRFQFPQVELKDKKLFVNGLEVEGLPEVDGFYINPNGESVAAYKMPTYKDRKSGIFNVVSQFKTPTSVTSGK